MSHAWHNVTPINRLKPMEVAPASRFMCIVASVSGLSGIVMFLAFWVWAVRYLVIPLIHHLPLH